MRYLLLFLAVFGPVALHAQNGNSESSQRWQALQERQIPALAKKPARTSPKSAQEKAQERQELVAHYSSLAAAAKSFRESFPEDPNAKAALAMEADSLLKMAFLGDGTRAAYTDTLVGDIERDTTLPPRVRYRIVALSEYLLRRQTVRSSSEARAAHETSARYLIKEFPHEVGGYLTLLSSVDASGDAVRVLAVVQEIEESPAPFAAKAAARVIATRHLLIGKSLADVANTALGRQNFFETARQRRTVLYTWATWSPGSVEFAKNVLGKIKGDVLVIGYNLDRDVEAAKAMARMEKLPGTHYYDSAGPGSWLTLLLSLNAAPLVYLTDQNGIITDVSAQRKNVLAVVNQGRAN
jgi:hypothetical protein